VRELKEEEFSALFAGEAALRPAARETVVETDLDAFIPEAYLKSDAERLAVYRRLYALSSPEQLEELRAELEDRFGRFPPEIRNLMAMVKLRLAAARIGFRKISLSGDTLEAEFPPDSDAAFYQGETFNTIMAGIPRMKKESAVLHQEGKKLTLAVRLSRIDIEGERIEKSIHLLEKISTPS